MSSFAEDQDGELYATILFPTGTYGAGTILALEEAPRRRRIRTRVRRALLSQTGCFAADAKTPLPALVPFEPSAQLYSDGATKRRWLALPDGKTIASGDDGDFDVPDRQRARQGVLRRGQARRDPILRPPGRRRPLGRLLVRWRADESDADLVGVAGATTPVGADMHTWTFPSRAQCHQCHTNVAGTTLGPELAQLNHDDRVSGDRTHREPARHAVGGRHARRPARCADRASLPSLANIADTDRTVDGSRARLPPRELRELPPPDGPTFTPLDLRFQTSLHDAGICDQLPTIDDLASSDPERPADPRARCPPDRSVLWQRMNTIDGSIRMPPIGRSLTDTAATA